MGHSRAFALVKLFFGSSINQLILINTRGADNINDDTVS